jgi:hypothetical protein
MKKEPSLLIGLLERLVLPPHAVERASFARESM